MNQGKLSHLSRIFAETGDIQECAKRLGITVDDVNAGLLTLASRQKTKKRAIVRKEDGDFEAKEVERRPVSLKSLSFLDPSRKLAFENDGVRDQRL